MNRKILNLLFISFISVCFVFGMFGRIAIAQLWSEPTRESSVSRQANAWEREVTSIGGMQYVTARQWTSPYDIAMGNIFPEVTYSYAAPDYSRMMNPFAPQYESSYEASGTGGLFTGPIVSFPVSPISYMMGAMGSPQVQQYQSQGIFTGSTNYQSIYPGYGLQTAGFMLGPFRNMWTGGYTGGTGYGYPSTGYGYPGITGGQTGYFPTRLF